MLTPKRFTGRLALAAAAALAAPLLTATPSASAGDVNWSVTVGSRGGGHGGHGSGYHDSGRRGYYKSVWRAPVYRTYYDDCGRAIRKCVRRGYYERVWVSAPRRSYTYGTTYHQPRHQRYDRRDRRRSCSW